ncbi:MAG: putative sulfate exporter family transporter [Rhodobacteraceae bacterium]|nr:putative sulfate exporter family transporter [Paracoccaceae bacterium]
MTEATPDSGAWFERITGQIQPLIPGMMVASVIALASQFVSEHYGAPAMLLALLFGISMNFLSSEPRCAPGVSFAAKKLLRIGVALLGLRISFEMIAALGVPVLVMIVLAVLLTIGFGLAVSRIFGFRYRFAFLSAGAVAICGASAAMAIAAILPKDERSEERLVFTVVGVTILSTVAMVVYPVISGALNFDDHTAGIYIGATIHDVAQVVGAGFSISQDAGETATLVKLLRVSMLAPVVIAGLIAVRTFSGSEAADGERPPLVPFFVVAFVLLAIANSTMPIPAAISDAVSWASRAALLVAIAAVGLKTVPQDLMKVGGAAAMLLLAETLFLAIFVGVALKFVLPLL